MQKNIYSRKILVLLLVVAFAFSGLPSLSGAGYAAEAKPKTSAAKKLGLRSFKDHKALKKYIKSVRKVEKKKQSAFRKKLKKYYSKVDRPLVDGAPGVVEESMAGQVVKSSNAKASAPGGSADSSTPDHSSTYNQVEGVEEADIIKSDGKHIYYATFDGDYYESCVKIVRADNGKVSKRSTILLDENNDEHNSYIQDLYIKDKKLYVIYTVYHGSPYLEYVGMKDPGFPRTVTKVSVYDVSNTRKPKRLDTYQQSGYTVASRMIGDIVYLITDDYVYEGSTKDVPYVTTKGKFKKISAKKVFAFPGSSSANFAVVGSLKLSKKGKFKTDSKAILGASTDIFCSLENLYLAKSNRGYFFDTFDWDMDDPFSMGTKSRTTILKVSISGGKISFKSKGQVTGTVNNQFSMDEHNGYFRVATTAVDSKGRDVNYLTVLNSNMKTVGRTKGFATGEHIESVRFIGDKGYVITYEYTDPLFVIDLKTPSKPRLQGSVKITGFSTLLHPAGNGKLLGIGYSTEFLENTTVEAQDGIKLALFNISNPAKPKVDHSKTFKSYHSSVQYDHRGLVVNKKRDYYAIPYYTYNDTGGVIVFSIKGNKLKTNKVWKTGSSIERCLYIGNYIYALTETGRIKAFKY